MEWWWGGTFQANSMTGNMTKLVTKRTVRRRYIMASCVKYHPFPTTTLFHPPTYKHVICKIHCSVRHIIQLKNPTFSRAASHRLWKSHRKPELCSDDSSVIIARFKPFASIRHGYHSPTNTNCNGVPREAVYLLSKAPQLKSSKIQSVEYWPVLQDVYQVSIISIFNRYSTFESQHSKTTECVDSCTASISFQFLHCQWAQEPVKKCAKEGFSYEKLGDVFIVTIGAFRQTTKRAYPICIPTTNQPYLIDEELLPGCTTFRP